MDFVEKGRTVIQLEVEELQRLRTRLGESFSLAVQSLRQCVEAGGKIIVCGVGKSGNVALKIAATLTSTGAPAVVLNPQDALHGDLGLVNSGDVVIAMSYSGETVELLNLLPHIRRLDIEIIAITGGVVSTLASNADIVLDCTVQREACPLNLAPTSSSTVMLVLGDALAMVLLEARGFREEDFAKYHPGGSLGRALLTKVSDIMRTGDRLPLVPADAPVLDALKSMTQSKAGAAAIIDGAGKLLGIFTQGDFTRAFQMHADVGARSVSEFMTTGPVTIHQDRLAVELLQLLEQHPVDDLIVLGDNGAPVGLIDTQDLSRAKIY